MSEGLLRQRRNLLIVCILLWFARYAGVTLNKGSFAGFEIEIKNVEAMFTALWIAFAYFLYRYYQYFSSEGPPKITGTFVAVFDEKCRPVIQHVVGAAGGNQGGGATISWSAIRQRGWSYPGFRQKQDNIGQMVGENFEIPISRKVLVRPVALGVLDTAFRNSVVTDYLLPFALAGWVLWYCGDPTWKGSYIRMLFE